MVIRNTKEHVEFKIFFLLVYFCCIPSLLSQNHAIEEYTKMPMYQSMNHYALEFVKNPKNTLQVFDSISFNINKSKNNELIFDWNYIIALAIEKRVPEKKYDSIFQILDRIKVKLSPSFPYKSKLQMLESFDSYYAGFWAKSLDDFKKTSLLALQEKDTLSYIISTKQVGYIKTLARNDSEGLSLSKNIMQLINKKIDSNSALYPDKNLLLEKALGQVALAYVFKKPFEKDSIKEYCKRFVEASKQVNDSMMLGNAYIISAYGNAKIQEFDNAAIELHKAEKFGHSIKSYADRIKAEIHLQNNQFEKAIKLVLGTIEGFDPEDLGYPWLHDEFQFLAKAYKLNGDYKSSAEYFEHYSNSSAKFDKILDTVSRQIRMNRIENFKEELDAIEKEKEQKDSFIKYLIVAGGSLILGLLFALLYFYRQKNKNEQKFIALLDQIQSSEKQELIIDTKDENLDEKSSNQVNPETTKLILEGLEKLKEQQYYLRQECSAHNVAKKIKTNTSYLSKVVNSTYQKNFNTYINDLRINYAIVKLKKDSKFRAYSIQGISKELGYKTADSFTKYFKQHTGLLPSFYIKKLNDLD